MTTKSDKRLLLRGKNHNLENTIDISGREETAHMIHPDKAVQPLPDKMIIHSY